MLIDQLDDLLDTSMLSDLLGVSRSTIRSMLRAGCLPFIKINGRRRVLKKDLEKYLADNMYFSGEA